MNTWPFRTQKPVQRVSRRLSRRAADGDQARRRGRSSCSRDEWRRLRAAARPSLKQLLLSDAASDDPVPSGARAAAAWRRLTLYVSAGHHVVSECESAPARWRAGVDLQRRRRRSPLSVVTLAEIQAVSRSTASRTGEGARSSAGWTCGGVVQRSRDGRATFRAWAKLMHRRSDTVYEDAMIAATAKSTS